LRDQSGGKASAGVSPSNDLSGPAQERESKQGSKTKTFTPGKTENEGIQTNPIPAFVEWAGLILLFDGEAVVHTNDPTSAAKLIS
jgi:hypothetical protein